MLSSLLTVALLSTATFAVPQEKRQATDAAQFTSAASELVSKYIPSGILPGFESTINAAASAASVTGDAKSLIYDALLGSSIPIWFASAVPAEYKSQIAALEGDISALRGPASTSGGGLVPIVVAITTTDSAGSTYTTSVTSGTATVTSTTAGVVTTTATTGSSSGSGSGASSTYSTLTTEVISGLTSVFSTVVVGGSVATKITSGAGGVGSTITSGAGGVLTTIVSGGSSIVSKISSGGGGVVSTISSGGSGALSSATSKAQGAVPTAVSGAAVGIVGLVGMMIAL